MEEESAKWYVDTETYGCPVGWTEDGATFEVYYDHKRGGYLPMTRRRIWFKRGLDWLGTIAVVVALFGWAWTIGALKDHHGVYAGIILAAPIFYGIGRYHRMNE